MSDNCFFCKDIRFRVQKISFWKLRNESLAGHIVFRVASEKAFRRVLCESASENSCDIVSCYPLSSQWLEWHNQQKYLVRVAHIVPFSASSSSEFLFVSALASSYSVSPPVSAQLRQLCLLACPMVSAHLPCLCLFVCPRMLCSVLPSTTWASLCFRLILKEKWTIHNFP